VDDVNAQVNAELALIPRGSFSQNKLRSLYQMTRANALGVNAEAPLSAREVLERATAMIREDDPGFEPDYDPMLIADSHGEHE
jgi:hypothetical protein